MNFVCKFSVREKTIEYYQGWNNDSQSRNVTLRTKSIHSWQMHAITKWYMTKINILYFLPDFERKTDCQQSVKKFSTTFTCFSSGYEASKLMFQRTAQIGHQTYRAAAPVVQHDLTLFRPKLWLTCILQLSNFHFQMLEGFSGPMETNDETNEWT